MEKTLHILYYYMGDSEDFLSLATQRLKEAGYTVVFQHVDTIEALRKALESQSWDVVLSDYVISEVNGQEALRITKEYDFTLPFIFISGSANEENAVEAMKAGADGYLVKDNLLRFATSIEHEIFHAKILR
ncbi:MAG: response regulator, partial [Candidatus Omnitrophica bacterium]|nr:response regulator [Candidatus Omnitrophota bacterium]